MKIIIGGDVSPINSNENYFKNNSQIFGELQKVFNESDLNIINLEIPLTESNDRILKSGGNIKGPKFAADSLKKSNVHIVSLANNHIGDFSNVGVVDTLNVCKTSGLKTIGAGNNLQESSQPIIIDENHLKVGLISFSDLEFGMASKSEPGANPLDLCELSLSVLELKKKTDYIIVILHEGKEYYKYPSPDLQKMCRYICDIGADAVICQHSHVIGAWEKYKKSNIFYGQGNLMFDYDNRNFEAWKLGFLIEIVINEDKEVSISQIPYRQSFPGIKKLSTQEASKFYDESEEMSKNVKDEEFIHKSWSDFTEKYKLIYFSIFRGHNRILRKLNSIFAVSNLFYSKRNKAMLLNVIRSRVHREVVIDILEKEIKS